MALYHVHADVISKGQARGGAAGFSAYLQREDRDHSTQMARYLQREGWSAEDLVAKGEGALPAWAPSGTLFFLAADVYERQHATVARTYEIALPRELSPDQRLELAADLRTTFFEQYPHVWAIHNPVDARGADHPHLHLMLSERRETDGHERGPALLLPPGGWPPARPNDPWRQERSELAGTGTLAGDPCRHRSAAQCGPGAGGCRHRGVA